MPAAVGARHAAAQYLKVSGLFICNLLEQCTTAPCACWDWTMVHVLRLSQL